MIAENIVHIRERMPEGVRLVAVSKLKPTSDIQEAYAAGQRLFGENYPLELRDKASALPSDIEWHFIGHIQSKQIKYYIPFVSMIHGIDSVEHLEAVEREASKVGRRVDGLLQVHVAQEATKAGFAPSELLDGQLLSRLHLPHVRLRGVMGMATRTTDEALVRSEFRTLRQVFDQLKHGAFDGSDGFDTLSMGMSHDWPIAIEEGSNLVRLGTVIFGERQYTK